jgi:hypothetical protein
MSLPVTLRPPQTTRELNLVRSSWTKSMMRTRPVRVRFDEGSRARVTMLDNRTFVEGHARQVDRTLSRASLILAVPTATETTIAGWICFDAECVHYAYVVSTFRSMGVARELLEQAGAIPRAFSQWSHACDRGLGSKLEARGWVWDPTRFG